MISWHTRRFIYKEDWMVRLELIKALIKHLLIEHRAKRQKVEKEEESTDEEQPIEVHITLRFHPRLAKVYKDGENLTFTVT